MMATISQNKKRRRRKTRRKKKKNQSLVSFIRNQQIPSIWDKTKKADFKPLVRILSKISNKTKRLQSRSIIHPVAGAIFLLLEI